MDGLHRHYSRVRNVYRRRSIKSISPVEETVEVAARGVNLVRTVIDSSLVSVALTENYQGRSAQVYLGVLSSGAVVSNPFLDV